MRGCTRLRLKPGILEATMAANRDEPGVPRRPGADHNAVPLARTELTEALAELRRLIQDPSLDRLERTLTDLGQAPMPFSLLVG